MYRDVYLVYIHSQMLSHVAFSPFQQQQHISVSQIVYCLQKTAIARLSVSPRFQTFTNVHYLMLNLSCNPLLMTPDWPCLYKFWVKAKVLRITLIISSMILWLQCPIKLRTHFTIY